MGIEFIGNKQTGYSLAGLERVYTIQDQTPLNHKLVHKSFITKLFNRVMKRSVELQLSGYKGAVEVDVEGLSEYLSNLYGCEDKEAFTKCIKEVQKRYKKSKKKDGKPSLLTDEFFKQTLERYITGLMENGINLMAPW